ncbi:MAG: PilW family protein [Candidatus Methylomirabilales bacterium]
MSDRRNRHISLQGEGGFTLAEVLITTVISSIILLGVYLMYDVNQVTFIKGEQQADIQQNARIGMDRIVRELRMAGSDPSGVLSGGPDIPGTGTRCTTPPPVSPQAIEIAEASCVRFYADVDSDSATERVEYSYDAAAQLVRRRLWTPAGTSAGAQPLAERVTALSFVYYDGANNPLPAPVPAASLGSIRRISVILTTADTVTGKLPQPFTLQADIRPRNLGL